MWARHLAHMVSVYHSTISNYYLPDMPFLDIEHSTGLKAIAPCKFIKYGTVVRGVVTSDMSNLNAPSVSTSIANDITNLVHDVQPVTNLVERLTKSCPIMRGIHLRKSKQGFFLQPFTCLRLLNPVTRNSKIPIIVARLPRITGKANCPTNDLTLRLY